MADITFAMERDSSHRVAKNKLDVRSKSEEHKSQPACDCRSLVFRRYRRVIVLALYLMVQEGCFCINCLNILIC